MTELSELNSWNSVGILYGFFITGPGVFKLCKSRPWYVQHLNVKCYVYKPYNGNDNIDLNNKYFFSERDSKLLEWGSPHLTLDMAGAPLLWRQAERGGDVWLEETPGRLQPLNIQGGLIGETERLFTRTCKWQHEGQQFFTVRMTEHWYSLLREVAEPRSFVIFRSCLGMVLGNQL